MVDRRTMLRGVATGVILASSQAATGCSLAEFTDDAWGEKLIRYLRTGDETLLRGMFRADSSLIAYGGELIGGTDALSYSGAKGVRTALSAFRATHTAIGAGDTPRLLKRAAIVGSGQQGRMNKIELTFSEERAVDTSCGPTTSEMDADLFFEAGADMVNANDVEWFVKRIALMPRLELARAGIESDQ